MIAALDALRATGALSPLDEHFARAMGRIAAESRPEVLLATALVSRHVSNGHVCLDLAQLAGGAALVDDAGRPVPPESFPRLDAWRAALQSSALVGGPTDATPLVLDDADRLYLRRYWTHQERLAAAIRVRSAQIDTVTEHAWLTQTLDRLFPTDSGALDWQRIAALMAVQRPFLVISGGPGTGKTFTVVKILALLIEAALQMGRRPPRITLVAPTGKAAARLAESIRRTKPTLPCAEAVAQAIPDDAATIHRCLGTIDGSATRFRHGADNPLVTDLLLVDEASMVDLALMARLFDAVPQHARVILLGDEDQLASVEAGAVLGDICNNGGTRCYSRGLVETVAALTGDRLPLLPDAPRTTGIWDCIVQLTHSYRYSTDSGVSELARAINAGDSDAALTILDSDDYPDVRLAAPTTDGRLSPALRNAVMHGFAAYLREGQPLERLRAFERFRVLCAHRRGWAGVEWVNRQIEALLAAAEPIRNDSHLDIGQPIIVTRNNYQLGLFNGDVGLIMRDPARADGRVAFFVAPDGTPRTLSPSQLPPHEKVFAMSVHKSQGSEFDEVAVLLPQQMSPVVSRELLYTAVTRARRQVTIHAPREVVGQAITHRIERTSGLRDLLWG
jgi:exodeoxyribonuclease V alpha subunit